LLFIPGKFPIAELEELIHKAAAIDEEGDRVAFLSEMFLGTPYRESTLIGDMGRSEVLVANLEGVDCFTLLDYVEAMRLSGSFADFEENLEKVRYHSGRISFETRNHFFTDWTEYNRFVDDVTGKVGGENVRTTTKVLNMKEDGTTFVAGISPIEREISCIPTDALDEVMMKRLATGDYAGICSSVAGLDVSHVGIIIKKKGVVYLRHASKRHGLVMDEEFAVYIAKTPGIIVLRPRRQRRGLRV
jgi:N-acetylmuramoyl-L-alanine amidase-like